jgi:hypothetical protein
MCAPVRACVSVLSSTLIGILVSFLLQFTVANASLSKYAAIKICYRLVM